MPDTVVTLNQGETRLIYAEVSPDSGTLTISATPTVTLYNSSGVAVVSHVDLPVTDYDEGSLSSVRAWYALSTAAHDPGDYTLAFTIVAENDDGVSQTFLVRAKITLYATTVTGTSYATVADVQARLPTQLLTVGTSSQPTTAQVTAWLADESRWIDGTLAWKYVTPVTNGVDKTVLTDAVADLVAARCWRVLTGHNEEEPKDADNLQEQAYRRISYDAATGRAKVGLPNTPQCAWVF